MSVRETLELDIRPALTNVGQLDKALTQATSKLKTGLAEATNQLGAANANGGLTKGVAEAGAAAQKSATGFDALESSARRTITTAKQGEGSFLGLSRVVDQAGQAALIAGTAITGALVLGIKAAANLETALLPIGTLLGVNSREAATLSAALKDVIASSPESAEQIGLSAYTILSAGITGTANVVKTLGASQKLAEAGLGDLAQATDIVTSAINSFSGENLTANKAAQLFFGTISVGKTTTAGLAEGFGQVAPLAAAAGITFRQLLSATAALTATGQTASIAFTGLRGVVTSILQPSKEAADTAKQLGLDFSVARLQSVGLAQFLQEVGAAAGGSVQTLSTLFGSVEGVNAVLSLTGPQAKAFASNLAGIDEAGKNLNRRADEVRAAFGNQLKTAFNQAQVALAAVFTPFLPIIGTVARGAADIAEGFASLPQPVQQAGVGIASLAGGALLLAGTLATLSTRFNAAKGALIEFGRQGSAVDTATSAVGNNLGAISRGVAGLGVFFALGPQLEEITGDFTSAGAAAGALAGSLIGPEGALIGAVLGTIAGEIGLLGANADGAAKRVAGLAGEIERLGAQQAAQKFIENFGVAVDQLGRSQALVRFVDGFKLLAKESPAAAARVLEGLRQLQNQGAKPIVPPAVFAALETQLALSSTAFSKSAKNAKEAGAANLALAGALTSVSTASDDATKAQEEYISGLAKGLPSVTSFFDTATGKIKDFNAASSPAEILKNFQDQLAGIRDFNIRVQELLDAGLTELARIAIEKGPIAGAEIAQAFREADPETQRALNDTAAGVRAKLGDLSAFIGGPYANALFNTGATAGTNIGQGLAFGLANTREEAERQAIATGEAISRAFDSQFRFGSPSKVAIQWGSWISEGFAIGMDRGTERFIGRGGRLTLRPAVLGGGGGSSAVAIDLGVSVDLAKGEVTATATRDGKTLAVRRQNIRSDVRGL